jgi:hypothetical protein
LRVSVVNTKVSLKQIIQRVFACRWQAWLKRAWVQIPLRYYRGKSQVAWVTSCPRAVFFNIHHSLSPFGEFLSFA